MSAPYRDVVSAVRAALNVDARSLYKPAGWQALAGSGYRESTTRSDLSKLEHFQQDCMTLAFLNDRLPPHLWAVLILRHQLKTVAEKPELDRLVSAMLVAAGRVDYPDLTFTRWAVAHWAGRLTGARAKWDWWTSHGDRPVPTLKEHYGKRIKPQLDGMLASADASAERLLSDAGLIERAAA